MLKLISANKVSHDQVFEYYNSFPENKRDKNNLGARIISVIAESPFAYLCYLEGKTYSNDIEVFFLYDDATPDYIIGFGSIKKTEDCDIYDDEPVEGNIRFGIRENERNKEYGAKLITLLLEECQKRGMDTICTTCQRDNIAAQATIEKAGGTFKQHRESKDPNKLMEVLVYMFNLPKLAEDTKNKNNKRFIKRQFRKHKKTQN